MDQISGQGTCAKKPHIYAPLLGLLGTPGNTALFMSVLMGFSVVEKDLKLPDYPAPDTADYEARLRHMMQAALNYEGPKI